MNALSILCAFGLIAFGFFQSPVCAGLERDASTRPWTILLYGAVDNSADDPFVEFTDRMRRAIDDDPGIELVMFIDRSDQHRNGETYLGDEFSGSRLYRVRKDSVERLAGGTYFPEITIDGDVELNSADAGTLQRFIAWGKANYPAEKYGLLIYSHADGKTMCPDETQQADMGIAELTDEIGVKERVDFLALELCNMGGAEIAYQWRPGNGRFESDVLVAIPNAGPPLDWHRAFGRIRSEGHAPTEGSAVDPATMTAVDFGNLVIEEGFKGRQESEQREGGRSMESAACYDLHKADAVKKSVDALAVALAKSNSRDIVVEYRNDNVVDRVIRYSGDGSYMDLYDMCQRMAEGDALSKRVRAAARDVLSSVDEFIVSSFGMSGYKDFQADKNGVFIVLPSGLPDCWKHYRWYTPEKGGGMRYGNWSFLRDGAAANNDNVENWYELLKSWFAGVDEKESVVSLEAVKVELARLQGTWKPVSWEERRESPPAEAIKDISLIINGNEWNMVVPGNQEQVLKHTVVIDPTTTPKTVDMTAHMGRKEMLSPAIYKIEGDTLTLRRTTGMGDVARPQEFTTTNREGVLIVWKRTTE